MIVEVLVFIVVLLLTVSVWQKWSHTTEKFPPGPMGLPILGYLPFLGREPHKTLANLSKKYGDIFSIYLGSTRAVVLNKVEHIREAGKRDDFSGRPELEFNIMWGGGGTDKVHGIIFNEGDDWLEQRRFTLRHLRDLGFGRKTMEDLILHEVQQLIGKLESNINEPVAVDKLFEISVINALWTLVAGDGFKTEDTDLIDTIEKMTRHITEANTTGLVYFFPRFSRLFPFISGWTEFEEAIVKVRKLCTDVINKHRKRSFDPEHPEDFIEIFMKMMQETKDKNSSFYGSKGDISILATVMDLFGAGVETTSSGMSWAILFISYFPRVQKKLQEELDTVVGRHRTPSLTDKLPYLEATIQEVIRFSGMVPLLLQHRVTKDAEFQGYLIPNGTLVILNADKAAHDPDHWDKPEEFMPERFIGPDGSLISNDAFLIFGVGKRVCIGERLARSEMFLFLSCILQKFSLTLQSEPKPTLKPRSPGIVLHPSPFLLKLAHRDV